MKDVRIWRTIPGGVGVASGTAVNYYKHVDTNLLGTVTTDANGLATYSQDGHPGPYYATMTSGGTTKVISSKTTGTSGPANLWALPNYFRLWSDGVVQGVDSDLAVTAPGTGMTVSVAKGQGLVTGILYDMVSSTLPLVIAAANGSNPRIDTVVVRVQRSGAVEEGKAELAVRTGTAAASPVAPALSQTATEWEYALADVRVDAAVTAVASNKVTDRRTYAAPVLQGNTVGVATLTAAGQVSTAEIAKLLKAPTSDNTPSFATLNLGELNDVSGAAAADGQFLQFNGTLWVPISVSAGTAPHTHAATDVNSLILAIGRIPTGGSGSGSTVSFSNHNHTGTYAPLSHTHNADDVNAGILNVNRIPLMNANKINAGVFATAQIPDLAAADITSGVFAVGRIPTLFDHAGFAGQVSVNNATTTFENAVSQAYTLPAGGTWTIIATGVMSAYHSLAGGSTDARLASGSDTGVEVGLVSDDTQDRVSIPSKVERTGIAGGTAITVVWQFRTNAASGSAQAIAWNMHLSAVRTA